MHMHGLEKSKRLIRIQGFVLVTGILLMVIKAFAYWLTNSNTVLTDALESVINNLAGAFALYSLYFASKPPDRNHPYGHGKIEFVSASIEAGLIMSAGIIMIGKAGYNLFNPQVIQEIDTGIYLTGGAGLVNFLLGGILIHEGKKHDSMTMEADGKHLMSDALSTVGMIIGLGILYFYPTEVWIDNSIAILFGAVITWTGIRILKKSIPGILDEADMSVLRKIVQVLNEHRTNNWIDLHNLRLIKYGSVYHLDCHITLPWYFDVKKAHHEIGEVENLIQEHFGERAEMFIHIDPCKASSCPLCPIENCDVRQKAFEGRVEWNMENMLAEKQHGDE